MKKILMSAIAIMAFSFANAQESTGVGFSEGDLFMTGSFGYTSTKTGDVKTNEFSIAPRVGYFVTSNIAVGGQLGYVSGTETDEFDAETDTNVFTVGAFGRYYFTPARNFSFFGHLGLDYASAKTEFEGGGETKADGFQLALAPGISYFVSDHIALEATFGALGYSTYEVDGADDSTDSFELSADLTNITFGILYKF
jgi:hypothetical protein